MANQNYEQKQSQNLSDDDRNNKAGQNASTQKDQAGRKDQMKSPGASPADEDEE